ncbi:MAG: replicative DNA helicase [Actinomycetota bacterium]
MVQPLEDARRRRPPARSSSGGRVPPHNLEAEESLLGAMLLSRDAIVSAVELQLGAESFYRPAHGHVFDAITSIYAQGEPADPVTVAEELRRAGLLDAIGGPPALVGLQANTPAIGNAARYARIVEEHALLRKLIGVAGEIAEMGYSMPDDVTAAIDEAEAMVFDVAQRRVTDTLAPLRDLLERQLDRIEALFERGNDITGVPTGYIDLDQQLAGLQPSNLVIVGGRPGTGKTSFALGIVTHAAVESRTPVLLFSLEMSHLELTQRMLCSEARVDATRMRNGRLLEADWPKISHAVGRLAEAPVYIDDNPHLTVMEIRAKARRLKSRSGLGLIVIDYLQLMAGRQSAENRQVEVSEISRGLKILARELEVPVVALSQLSRGLESRADKRPQLADLRESGCMPATTRVAMADGTERTLGELLLSQDRPDVWSLDDEWRLVAAPMTKVFPSGIRPVYRLRLASGHEVDATANHPFRTVSGWRALGTLAPGDHLAVPRRAGPVAPGAPWDDDEVVLLAHLLGNGSIGPADVRCSAADPANSAVVTDAARRLFGSEVTGPNVGGTGLLRLPSPYRVTPGRRHPIRNWLEPLGIWGSRSHEKFVPEVLYRLPDDQLRLFLRHLWAAGGSIRVSRNRRGQKVQVYYSTPSRRMADGVRRLLLRMDVRCRVSPARKAAYQEAWRVRIEGADNQTRFLVGVGCHGAGGASIPEALSILGNGEAKPDRDFVPWEVAGRVEAAAASAGVTHRELAAHLGDRHGGSFLLGSEGRPRRFSRDHLRRMGELVQGPELVALATSDVFWDQVVEISPLGEQPTFDATVDGTHNFVANGVVAHNSLEQDADVVVFLYRDEVYNRDSPDRGTAEVIVAKHRNGPTGMTQLAFLDHYTRFANMAKGV